MVQTYPGSPWQYTRSGTEASNTGTIAWTAATSMVGLCYLTKAVVTYDASAVGKWWLYQDTTATVFLGPFYPTTCQTWIFDFGPVGLHTATTTSSYNVGWVCSTSGIFNIQLIGYAV